MVPVRLDLTLLQVDRATVHAPALAAGRPRAVVEEVAQVGVAAGAADLGPAHAVGAVVEQLDGVGRDRFGEAGPAGPGVELRAALEEGVAAGQAAVEPVVLGVDVGAGEGALRAGLPQHL